MPETDTIPVSASVASTGPGIRYIGDYAYAYSGLAQTEGDNSPITRMEFTTGSGLIDAKLQALMASGNNDDLYWQLYLNDIQIGQVYNQTPPNTETPNALFLILPPFTKVTVKIANGQSSSARDMYIVFTGRVYGEK